MRGRLFITGMAFLLIGLAGCSGAVDRTSRAPEPSVVLPGWDLVPSVHFATGSERVLRRERWVVEHNARWLRAHPEAVLVLEGHCDERGTVDFNRALGDRRARGVLEELLRQGVPTHRLIIVSHGEERPLDRAPTSEGWRTNRRVAFVAR